jgi:hypothetical protein
MMEALMKDNGKGGYPMAEVIFLIIKVYLKLKAKNQNMEYLKTMC